jgi:hypothetical protein
MTITIITGSGSHHVTITREANRGLQWIDGLS